MSEFLTTKQIADLLQISTLTAWKWCREGKLPAFRVGKNWRVREDDFRKFVNERIKANRLNISKQKDERFNNEVSQLSTS